MNRNRLGFFAWMAVVVLWVAACGGGGDGSGTNATSTAAKTSEEAVAETDAAQGEAPAEAEDADPADADTVTEETSETAVETAEAEPPPEEPQPKTVSQPKVDTYNHPDNPSHRVYPGDLEGSWRYATGSFQGEMIFDSQARLIEFTNSKCSYQIANASVFVESDSRYEVKIRQYNWCNDYSQYLKFALNFTDSSKTRLEGIVDLHNDPDYKRYGVSMWKN